MEVFFPDCDQLDPRHEALARTDRDLHRLQGAAPRALPAFPKAAPAPAPSSSTSSLLVPVPDADAASAAESAVEFVFETCVAVCLRSCIRRVW